MPGRFQKAPLIYATARIATTELPGLSSDQRALLEQALVKQGLPELKYATARELDLSQLTESPEGGHNGEGNPYRRITRRAFLSDDQSECLVLSNDGLEFRCSKYSRYSNFMDRFQQLLSVLVDTVEAYRNVLAQEFVLSYSDLVVPYQGRRLADYFNEDGSILPLNALGPQEEGEQRFGQVQATRIMAPNERIQILLEELPLVNGRVTRFLPQALVEPMRNLTMPLFPNFPEKPSSTTYGLMMTQAARLENVKLGAVDLPDTFASLHELTKNTFWQLLNEEVCKEDWQYQEK